MPTTRSSQAKRQKTSPSRSVVLDTTECITFDTLLDEEYPLDRIEEHLLRLLTYEPTQGIAEVLALAIRSIGCQIRLEITGVGASASDIISEAEAIEEACLNSSTRCPSAYIMQRAGYSKRVCEFLASIAERLEESGNANSMLVLAKYIALLSTARLQSLRYTSTMFSGSLIRQIPETGSGATTLKRALNERTADIAPPIRKAAITALASTGNITAAVRAFNDPVGTVRLTAIRALMQIPGGDIHMGDDAWNRVVQLAQQDSELAVRRGALKFLVSRGIEHEVDIVDMLIDDDSQSRIYAATFFVEQLAMNNDSPWALLVALVDSSIELLSHPSGNAAAALATALCKQKRMARVNWLDEMGKLLTWDLIKESRGSNLSAITKKQYRTFASKLNGVATQRCLLSLYESMVSITRAEAGATLLSTLPRLISKLRYDDDLLAIAINIASYLPSEKLLEHPDSEEQIQDLFHQILELLTERSALGVAKAASMAFSALPESHRLRLLRDSYHDLRLKLATYLGPRGEVSNKNKTSTSHAITQLLVLARFIDISDLAKLPIWPLLMQGDQQMRQLVRALGMKGNKELAELCVEKLMDLPSGPAVDEILQIHVSAKMRGVELTELSLNINEQPPSEERVWTAAVAAGVI